VIIYPTGGGTGLVGMWKAFEELEAVGWIGSARPRMVAVQAAGCAPIARAFHAGAEFAEPWTDAATYAAGMRVPAAVADFIMLRILRQSGGTAVAVEDAAMAAGAAEMARTEGIFPCPEGGATLAALHQLRDLDWVGARDRVVLFNTGSPYKYLDVKPEG
jgi:threonine synthase